MVSKYDNKAKEERSRCVRENRIENTSIIGNVVLQSGKEIIEKSASEIIKSKDSNDHSEDFMNHEYGENAN